MILKKLIQVVVDVLRGDNRVEKRSQLVKATSLASRAIDMATRLDRQLVAEHEHIDRTVDKLVRELSKLEPVITDREIEFERKALTAVYEGLGELRALANPITKGAVAAGQAGPTECCGRCGNG